MAYRHTQSGGVGLEDLALIPDPSNNHHNEHVKLILGKKLGNTDLTYVETPMYDKKACCRTKVMVPIVRPSEAVSEYFLGHTGACGVNDHTEELPDVPHVDMASLPPAQRDHDVVKHALANGTHPTRIRRLGIFMDAVGFTQSESFEGLFVNDLDTGMRWLVAVLRKAEMCKCGCRGFCTFWPLHDALLNDLQFAADGKWGVVSHLREPFLEGTVAHKRAGSPMGLVLAVTEIRADMPGYTGPMGFRASSHVTHGCCVCNVKKESLCELENVTLDGGPAELFDTEQYRALLEEFRHVVTISSPADVRAVLTDGRLEYDHRKQNGFMGRTLKGEVTLSSGEMLIPGDRLHPSRLLRDVGDFENQPKSAYPFKCLFWRLGDPKTARLIHHSPLMDIPGVGMQSYAIDILHTWHLGGIPRYCGTALWAILRSDAYAHDLPEHLYAEDVMHIKMLRLRSDLWLHYKAMQRSDPTWRKKASQVWNLTLEMLGKEWNPVLRAKASESRHLLDFCVKVVEAKQANLDPNCAGFLLAGGRAAQTVNDIMRDSPQIMSVDDQQRLLDAYIRHCTMHIRSGGNFVPKHHLMLHCIQRIAVLGNPRWYHCYHDESLNGVVKKIAKSCHRMTFMHSVHQKYRWAGKVGLSHHMY